MAAAVPVNAEAAAAATSFVEHSANVNAMQPHHAGAMDNYSLRILLPSQQQLEFKVGQETLPLMKDAPRVSERGSYRKEEEEGPLQHLRKRRGEILLGGKTPPGLITQAAMKACHHHVLPFRSILRATRAGSLNFFTRGMQNCLTRLNPVLP